MTNLLLFTLNITLKTSFIVIGIGYLVDYFTLSTFLFLNLLISSSSRLLLSILSILSTFSLSIILSVSLLLFIFSFVSWSFLYHFYLSFTYLTLIEDYPSFIFHFFQFKLFCASCKDHQRSWIEYKFIVLICRCYASIFYYCIASLRKKFFVFTMLRK